MEDMKVKKLIVHTDERGWLSEILRAEELENKQFGQIIMTTAKKSIVKGNHYHTRKKEWYCVIKGRMKLVLKDRATGKVEEMILDGEELKTVKITPNISHGFKNIGGGMLYLLIYIDEPFDKDNPDTFPEQVVG